jgi:glycerophosphoryl diester phosphodiesterase
VLIIAHRGASGEFPENTLLAFEQAIEQQADGIELDVQYHPSGKLLLLHDRFLDKHTSEKGHFSTLTEIQISTLKILPDQPIATLEQALACINGRCIVNIELKCASDNAEEISCLLKHIRDAIEQAILVHNFKSQQFVISSFNHLLLKWSQKTLPNIKIAALIASNPLSITSLTEGLNLSSLNPSVECLNHSLVKHCKEAGLEVWVYTVDRQYDIAKCHAFNVDAIFTNFPAKSREILDNEQSS